MQKSGNQGNEWINEKTEYNLGPGVITVIELLVYIFSKALKQSLLFLSCSVSKSMHKHALST